MTDEHGAHGSIEFEKKDVNAASVVKAGLIVVGVSTLTALALIAFMHLLVRHEARQAREPRAFSFEAGRKPPLPRLQETPFQDIQTLRKEEDGVLNLERAAWADRDKGIVRLPIDDALTRFVARAAAGQLTVGPAPAPSPAPAAAPSGATR